MDFFELSNSLLIGQGLDRKCYQHPDDQDKCIKVTFSGDYRQHRDDIKNYRRMQKCNISWQHMARFHDICRTSFGEGLIFDLIHDYDGTISRSLHSYLRENNSRQIANTLIRELNVLNSYLQENGIIMRDLKDDNLLLQRSEDEQARLIIIDGVGNNEFIPISSFFKPLRTSKIRRKWSKFIQTLNIR